MRTEGYTNLLDIACGYTPRGIYCDKEKIAYVGVDVPVVAEELQGMAEKLGIGSAYIGGDATNAASLKAAADRLGERVAISCEGLSQYLSTDEFEQLLGGIRDILKQHGGAWVTSDMGVDYEAFAVACMSSPDAAEMYNNARHVAMESSNIYNDGIALWDSGRKQRFIEEHGLTVKQVPFYHGDEDLTMLKGIPEGWKSALTGLLKEVRLWVMTASESDGDEKISGAKQVEDLKISYEKKDSTLYCAVSGRIDTISAPALMEVFENNYDGISEIKVDAKELEYISSAGLRVLMMGVKKVGQVTVEHTSDEVKEIFETTGFDQMMRVE